MSSGPLVSIITPAYNEEKFLPDCIDSIRKQSYDEMEHIVIDDGSTDSTLEVLEETDCEHLTWYNQSNRGLPATVNRGLEVASGDIFVWLNADDVLFKTSTVETIVKAFEQTDADFVYGSRAIINADNKLKRVDVPIPWFSTNRLRRYCFGSFIFFRSDVVKEQKLDTDFQHVCDYEYYLRAVENGFRFRYVDDILFAHRHHENTKTNVKSDEMREESQVCRDRYDIDADYGYLGRLAADRALGRFLQLWGAVQLFSVDSDCDLAFDIYSEPARKLLVRQFTTLIPRTIRKTLKT